VSDRQTNIQTDRQTDRGHFGHSTRLLLVLLRGAMAREKNNKKFEGEGPVEAKRRFWHALRLGEKDCGLWEKIFRARAARIWFQVIKNTIKRRAQVMEERITWEKCSLGDGNGFDTRARAPVDAF
jgi:hypothetical protein